MSALASTPRWGTVAQLAAELDVHPDTARAMIARGDVYAERVGPRLIRVDLNSIRRAPLGPGAGAAS